MKNKDRSDWPVRILRLEDSFEPSIATETTAEARIAMMWQLAQDAWAFAGRPIPDYDRSECPIAIIRPDDSPVSR